MLTAVWEYVERHTREQPAVWPTELLTCNNCSRRKAVIGSGDEPSDVYAVRVALLTKDLPSLPILPQNRSEFERGAQISFEYGRRTFSQFEQLAHEVRNGFRQALGEQPCSGGPMLHATMQDHIEWLKKEYETPGVGVTAWGRTRIKQIEILLEHHEDRPIAQIGHDEIELMLRHWRQRPKKKGSNQPITKKSAENPIAALRGFFKWLSRSTKYDWKKPRTSTRFAASRPRPETSDRRLGRRIFSRGTCLLNTYATPRTRLSFSAELRF